MRRYVATVGPSSFLRHKCADHFDLIAVAWACKSSYREMVNSSVVGAMVMGGVLAVASSACYRRTVKSPVVPPLTAKARMKNPLRNGGTLGTLGNIPVVLTNPDELLYHLPSGSLDKRGEVESIDATTACFKITLREMGPRVKWADLGAWKATLIVDDTTRLSSFKVNRLGDNTGAVKGRSIGMENTGMSFQCAHHDSTGACDRRALMPNSVMASREAEIPLMDTTNQLCFETKGAVTAESRSIALEFIAGPSQDAPENFRLQWSFED